LNTFNNNIDISGNVDMSGNFTIRGDLDLSGNFLSRGEIDQDFILPSGKVNKFISTNFLEGVIFGKGFSQDGTDTNSLDNLTLGGASSSNNLELTYDTGINQTGTATNTLKNLTLGDTGLTINDVNNIPQITIDPLGIIQLIPQGQNDFNAKTNFYNDVDISGNFVIKNGNSISITDTTNDIQISITEIGINQLDTTGENLFAGLTYFENAISQDNITLPSGMINKFVSTNFLEGVLFGKGISQNGTDDNYLDNLILDGVNGLQLVLDSGITQGGTATNSLQNLTIDGGTLTMTNTTGDLTISNGSITQTAPSLNTMINLQVETIALIPVIITGTSQDYSGTKMRNYIFHSRTNTAASGITLSNDANLDNGQYLYIRKIGTGSYTLTLTRGGTTTFLNLSNASVTTIAISNNTGVEFLYDKPNTRWIQLT
jgi:hypothetical protein